MAFFAFSLMSLVLSSACEKSTLLPAGSEAAAVFAPSDFRPFGLSKVRLNVEIGLKRMLPQCPIHPFIPESREIYEFFASHFNYAVENIKGA